MAPLRSLGNTASIFDDFYGRTGKDAVTPPVVPPFVFNSGTTNDIASTSTNDKVVIAYQDASNSNYGTAVVGTINLAENTITFGTPVVFEEATTDYIGIAYDSINDRVVIAFQDVDNSNYGTAVIGTITGDTISFTGSSTVFHSADTFDIDAVYDINDQRVVIGYRNDGPGYEGKSVVGTVDPSNNSISFGSEIEFSAIATGDISMVYDTLTRQIVAAYAETGTGIGKVNVGDVNHSNNTISWNSNGGGPYTFATDAGYVSATYCSLDNNTRVVVAYQDRADSNKGKVRVGTVGGGGTISFPSSAVEFESTVTTFIKIAYDPKNGKVVITYKASSKLKSIQGTVSGNTITFDSSEEILSSNSTGEMTLSYVSAGGKLVAAYQGLYQGNHGAGTASIVGDGSSDYIIYGGDVSGLQPGNGYQYHTFIEPGTLTITGSPVTAEVLMVGGGGAGGSDGAGGGTGGGGAGGLLYGTLTLTAGSYPIVVAASTPNNEGTSGNPTTAFGAIAQGGGFGQYAGSNTLDPGQHGGSGGGGCAGSPGGVGGYSNQIPYGTLTGYGYSGGSGGGPGTPRAGGGGGGAGGHGQVIPVDLRPNADNGGGPSSGGDGKQYSNFGGELIGIGPLAPLNAWFAGGGGGALGSSTNGGSGGGGAGAPGTGTQASDANNHSGGGGGGAAVYPNPGNSGGSGASGIVVLRINI